MGNLNQGRQSNGLISQTCSMILAVCFQLVTSHLLLDMN